MQDNVGSRPGVSITGFVLGIFLGTFSAPFLLAEEPASGVRDDVTVKVGVGGLGRFVTNRWGVVRGSIFNRRETATSNLIVVTPENSGALQYARLIEIPARASFDTVWPVRLGGSEMSGLTEFQFLHFPDGEDDGVIRHQRFEGQIPTFPGTTRNGPEGLTGWIADSRKGWRSDDPIQHMLRSMRYTKTGDQTIVSIPARDITERSECLDPLDTLAVSDSQLNDFPQTCEAIRIWVQRGGRLWILLDSTGSDVMNMLLGDCLPITVVGDTSANAVRLDINPEYPLDQYPVRTVDREFAEPVRYVRVIPEAGETIWSVDSWPVAMRVPLGRGCVVVSTISPDVFVEQKIDNADGKPIHTLIASSRRIQESLFNLRSAPLVSEAVASKQAAALIGYEIPSRRAALLFLVIFPVSLILLGVMLQRRAGGERLVWALPALAVLTAIPAVAFGLRIRAIAPATVIETTVIQSSPGQPRLASDGYATIYVPGPTDLGVSSDVGSRLDVPAEATNHDYRRVVWTGPEGSSWKNLSQAAGLKTFPFEAIRKPGALWKAVASFDENGIKGRLITDNPTAAADLLLAGMGLDQMSLTLDPNGEFRGSVSNVLNSGQFVQSSLISDEQRYRAALLEAVFSGKDRVEPFPAELSLLFWDEQEVPALQTSNKSARRKQSVLVVQTLQLQPPEAGKLITIPSPLLPYRSMATAVGSFSSAFNNGQKKWLPQESSGEILLQFQVPSVCVPLEVEAADVTLLIRAASRVVTVLSGSADNPALVAEFNSPLGTQSISIPADLVRESCLSGRLFVRIRISDLADSMKSETMTGEQDDSWTIERISLTLKGRRQSASSSPPTD